MRNKKAKTNMERKSLLWGYLFISPAIIGLILFSLGPILFSLFLSFNEWDIVSNMKFIGLDNFNELFRDNQTWIALKVTFYYTALTVPLSTIVTFFIAMLLNSRTKGIRIFRTIFYIPSIVPMVVSSAVWLYIFNPMFGMLNNLLGIFNLPQFNYVFSKAGVIPSLSMMAVWGAGNMVVIYLAGLQGVPRQLYEAAEIDGAGFWAKFKNVTIPIMSPIVFYNATMAIINCMQTFTQAFIMTDGGPDNASLFYSLHIYRKAFKYQSMGYAAALSWLLFLIIAVLTAVLFITSKKWVYYENEGGK